jgi:hypothetical protein
MAEGAERVCELGGCDSITQYTVVPATDFVVMHEVVSLIHSIFSLFHQPRRFACAYTKAQVATSSIIWRTRTMQVTGSYTLSFSPADHSDVSFLRQTKTVLSADRYQPFDRRTSQPRILKRCYIIRKRFILKVGLCSYWFVSILFYCRVGTYSTPPSAVHGRGGVLSLESSRDCKTTSTSQSSI